MGNNLRWFRENSGISKKELSKLLNVTIHTYYSYEMNTDVVPRVIFVMLAIIYETTEEEFYCDFEQISLKTKMNIQSLSRMSSEERYKKLSTNLLGESVGTATYHWVKIAKQRILDKIEEKQ